MKYIFALLAFFALTFSVHAQQPTPREILKLALGVSDAQLSKVYEVWGEKLNTVDVKRDTVWDISPVRDSLGVTTMDSVVSHVNETRTSRPAYAYEILSHWRGETIDRWRESKRAALEDSAKATAIKAIVVPKF